jgi:putative hemolysin
LVHIARVPEYKREDMKRHWLFLGIALALSGLALDGCCQPPADDTVLANPAIVHCEEQGYTVEPRTDEDGTYNVCTFPDGTECEVWLYYQGECGPKKEPADPTPAAMQTATLAPPTRPPSAAAYCEEQGYIVAYLNQFVSPDPIVPDYRNPQSIHRYLYAFANPVNLTDPSGLFAIGCGPETRNLTDWLVREMYRQSNSWPVQQGLFGMGIAPFNEIGSALLDDAWSDSDIWLHALAGQILDLPGLGLDAQQREELDRRRREAVTGMLLRGTAGLWWANMVKDGARWDFKDVIKTRLGESVMLCGTDECGWFEFSMPGNLFFSYVGRVAGFSEFEIRTGAIYAQQTDPENVWWLNTWYGLDQATDVAALELGFELYNLVGGAVSEDLLRMHFKYLVTMYRNRLAQADEPIEPYFTDFPIGLDGPKFPLRYFDGQNCLGIFGGG